MTPPQFVLPGDPLDREVSQRGSSKGLTLGPGLTFDDTEGAHALISGALVSAEKKNTLWLESTGKGRYTPVTGDLVIATVNRSAGEAFHCSISAYTPLALLPHLAFEGATKKTRPNLQPGSVVLARISSAGRHMEPELECVYPSKAGKADGLGELKNGMFFDISLSMSRRLAMAKPREEAKLGLLEDLGSQGLPFEIAVGRNGRLWVEGQDIKTTLLVGRAVQKTDQEDLDLGDQAKLVRKAVKTG